MSVCLAPQIERGLPAVARFLRIAIELENPSIPALTERGIPHYDARDLSARLEQAGELVDGSWDPAARASYRELLAGPPITARLQRLSDQERPREKAQRLGVGSLSDAELMALILRTGVEGEGVLELSQRLLDDHDGLLGLAERDVAELAMAHGLGPAKGAELASAFELGRRLAQSRRRDRPVLSRPEDAAAAVATEMVSLSHEELWCLPLDARSRLIGEPRMVTRGDIDGTDAGPRAFFRIALRAGAATAIAVHNHPSGEVDPSDADLVVTRALAAAGRAIGVELVDHLIIGDGGRFCSLRRTQPRCFGGP